MSLETWKEEYYPVSAKDADPKTALELSELKWLGLRPEALKKHELDKSGNCVKELLNNHKSFPKNLPIDESSCHLCSLYANRGQGCVACPITFYKQKRGFLSPDCEVSCGPEYLVWCYAGDPEPMIELLQAVKEADE